jgi:hypothetical protein
MAKGKKKQSSSDSSSESSSESEVSTSTSSSESSSSEESSSSSSDNRKSSKKSTKKSTKKSGKDSKKSGKSSKKSSKESSPKKRKSKKKKDPNAPKKATSAYFFYAAKRRDDYTKAGSTLSMLDKSKQIGIDWKALTDKEKAPYNKLAEADKIRAANDKANYTAPEKSSGDSSSDDDKPKKKKQKREKDPNAPKRPMNGYMLYVASQRPGLKEKSPGLKPTEITTLLGSQWKAMSEAEKKPFEKKSAEDKAAYEITLQKYNKTKK